MAQSQDVESADLLLLQYTLNEVEAGLLSLRQERSRMSKDDFDRELSLLQWKHELEEQIYQQQDYQLAIQTSKVCRMNQAEILDSIQHDEEEESEEDESEEESEPEVEQVCIACSETIAESDMLGTGCAHWYCQDCLTRLLQTSFTDEGLFPPRCCRVPLELNDARELIDQGLWEQYENKLIEHNDPFRLYCSDPTCSRYILPVNKTGNIGTCTVCRRRTCSLCTQIAHEGECADDREPVLELAREEGWQRCANCGHVIELRHGCYHITCLCGSEFCYLCGTQWKGCDCAQWNEDRLLEAAPVQLVQAAQPVRVLRRAPRRAAVTRLNLDRAMHRYRVDRECDHEIQWRRIAQIADCPRCRNPRRNLLECRVCEVRACRGCQRTRY